jgi:hypothetical protein
MIFKIYNFKNKSRGIKEVGALDKIVFETKIIKQINV